MRLPAEKGTVQSQRRMPKKKIPRSLQKARMRRQPS